MSEVVQEYLVEPRTAWVRRIRDELILPRRTLAARRPPIPAIRDGTATPREVVDGFLVPSLWRILRFPELVAVLGARYPTYDARRPAAGASARGDGVARATAA